MAYYVFGALCGEVGLSWDVVGGQGWRSLAYRAWPNATHRSRGLSPSSLGGLLTRAIGTEVTMICQPARTFAALRDVVHVMLDLIVCLALFPLHHGSLAARLVRPVRTILAGDAL